MVGGPAPPEGIHLGDVAAELALGALTGRERAEATAHLEICPACRAHVLDLTRTATQLLVLLPEDQPPAGFAARTIQRLPHAARHRTTPRPRDKFPAVAAAIIAVTCAMAGFALHVMPMQPRHAASPPALYPASLTTARHQSIGTVFLHGGSQPWLYMTVDTGPGNSTVICQLNERDGQIITVGSFQLASGYGSWGSPEPDQAAGITSVRLKNLDGTIVATATFTR